MLRRPLTSIELKLDDISEYDQMRKECAPSDRSDNGPVQPKLPTWQSGPKTKEEVYSRIGYVPPDRPRTRNTD